MPNLAPSINNAVMPRAKIKPLLYLWREYNKPTMAKNRGINPIYKNASDAGIDLKYSISKCSIKEYGVNKLKKSAG